MPRSRLLLPSSFCASVALVAGGVAFAAAPATAEPTPTFDQCAAPFPADELESGDVVTGLTTAGRASAVTPESFTGEYIDTLESDDGDTLVFDLSGSRITKDGAIDAGVWSGMSGSPVYASDGRLVGAVAYTFGDRQASTIAGVTPAAALYDLLDEDEVSAPERITLSSSQKKQLVAAGASSAELGKGARRIAPVSAITLPSKFAAAYATIAKRAGAPARDVSAGGSTLAEDLPIVAGGNLAAADSYGSISSYGLGTATAVCDDEVVGFGHPIQFRTSPRTIHGARTSFIQADGGGSYKLANLAAPKGALTHDGLAGIVGRLGQDLATTTITSKASNNGKAAKTYASKVPNPEALAEIAATHAFRDAALVQDQLAGGESLVSWSIDGTSVDDGKPIQVKRTQRFSQSDYLAPRLGEELAADILALQDNEFADIDVSDVTIDDTLASSYKALKIGSVQRYDTATKKWKAITTKSAVPARRGQYLQLRINLVKADKSSKAVPQTLTTRVFVSSFATGTGRLTVEGGDVPGYDDEDDFFSLIPWESDEYFFDEDEDDELTLPVKEPTSAAEVAALLSKQPRHDDVFVSHDLFTTNKGVVNIDRSARAASVVQGSFTFRVSYRR